MALLLYLATLLPGVVLAVLTLKRERRGAGLIIGLAVVGYLAGEYLWAWMDGYKLHTTPVWNELLTPWERPLTHLPAAAGATLGVALGVILLRKKQA